MRRLRNRQKQATLKPGKKYPVSRTISNRFPSIEPATVLYWIAISALAGFAIGLRIYKAHVAGITFDEAYTFIYYGYDLEKALGSFSRSNNHVLNSVLINFAYRWFADYEHFIRLPALAGGIWYVLASVATVHLTIQSKWLRFAALGLLFFSDKVFEYTYLARGYPFMFAALMTQVACIAYWCKHPIKFSRWWIVVLSLSFLNFISFGALLSSAIPLVAVNGFFIFLFSTCIYRSSPRYWKCAVIHLIGIGLVSLLLTVLLFSRILNHDVLTRVTQNDPGLNGVTVGNYLHQMLVSEIFRPNDLYGAILLWGVAGLGLAGLTWFAWHLYHSVRANGWQTFFSSNSVVLFVVGTAVGYFLMFLVYAVVLNRNLYRNHTRYHLYLLPLLILLLVVLLDFMCRTLKSRPASRWLCTLAAIILLMIPIHHFPSLQHVGGNRMSMSRTVLRELNKIHPTYPWRIAFTKNLYANHLGFWYYLRIKRYNWYLVRDERMIENKQYDLLICSTDEREALTNDETIYFLQDYLTPVKTAAIWNGRTPPHTDDFEYWKGTDF